MKVILCGQRSFGAAALEAIHKAGHEVVCVFSPPSIDGKADRTTSKAVYLGLEVRHGMRADNVPDGADLIVCAHSHDFVSQQALQKTKLGGIGYHPSLLPRHRGRDAVKWTIHMRDAVAGGSVYWLNDQVDAGPIAANQWCFVRPDDDASELWSRELFPMGVALLVKVLDDLEKGVMVMIPQDEHAATWEPSWGRAPLFRPDLIRLSGPATSAYSVVTRRELVNA